MNMRFDYAELDMPAIRRCTISLTDTGLGIFIPPPFAPPRQQHIAAADYFHFSSPMDDWPSPRAEVEPTWAMKATRGEIIMRFLAGRRRHAEAAPGPPPASHFYTHFAAPK